jgi:hypothetical protein
MRPIREEISVQDAVDDACERWARAEDAWEAIKWALARDPYIGTPLTEGGMVRSFTLEGLWAWEMPTITVVYEIDLHVISVHSVLFEDAATGPIGRA